VPVGVDVESVLGVFCGGTPLVDHHLPEVVRGLGAAGELERHANDGDGLHLAVAHDDQGDLGWRL